MKKLFIICFMVMSYMAMADSVVPLSEARKIADAYYGALQKIAQMPDGDGVFQNSQKIFKTIGTDDNGREIGGEFNVPNDIGVILGTDKGLDNITIRHYVNKFREASRKNKLVFSYDISDAKYFYSPGLEKSEATPSFALVVVKKTFATPSTAPIVITDTMCINAQTQAIVLVKNKYRQLSSLSESEMRTEADRLYSEERYDEAFQLYQEILHRNPQSYVSYYLGVMAFKGEGCRHYSRKVRDYLVEFYWQKTNDGRKQLILNHNTNNVILPFSGYEHNPFPSNRLLAYNWSKGKCGYISAQGKMVIKQQYRFAYPFFTNGTAIVQTDNSEWMLIDTNGRALEIYDNVSCVEHKYGCYNNWGKQLKVRKNGLEGVINRETGHWDIPMVYAGIYWRSNYCEPFYVVITNQVGILSASNTELFPIKYEHLAVIENDDDSSLSRSYVKVLCDYDEAEYDNLHKRYGNKIPDYELKKIGQLYVINLKK